MCCTIIYFTVRYSNYLPLLYCDITSCSVFCFILTLLYCIIICCIVMSCIMMFCMIMYCSALRVRCIDLVTESGCVRSWRGRRPLHLGATVLDCVPLLLAAAGFHHAPLVGHTSHRTPDGPNLWRRYLHLAAPPRNSRQDFLRAFLLGRQAGHHVELDVVKVRGHLAKGATRNTPTQGDVRLKKARANQVAHSKMTHVKRDLHPST